MFNRKHSLLFLLLLTFFATDLQAQNLESRPPTTGLALEVGFVKGVKPTYQTVPWTANKQGAWYARFENVGGVPAAGEQPVRAVRVVPFVEGAGVRVLVSVMRGKFHDVDEDVASYFLVEEQSVTVTELRSKGVGPFELRLVRINPVEAKPPAISYLTKSVEVVRVEAPLTTLPAYKLTIHNLSERAISALRIDVRSAGKVESNSLPQGQEGEALIAPGGYYEVSEYVPFVAKNAAEGFTLAIKPDPEIVITSLIFEDGSYEGDAVAAASFRGFQVGRKVELGRLNSVLALALASVDNDGNEAPAKLISKLHALRYNLPESELIPLLRAFPNLTEKSLRHSVEVSMHATRRNLIAQVMRFDKSGSEPAVFREWLAATTNRYDNWQARLQR